MGVESIKQKKHNITNTIYYGVASEEAKNINLPQFYRRMLPKTPLISYLMSNCTHESPAAPMLGQDSGRNETVDSSCIFPLSIDHHNLGCSTIFNIDIEQLAYITVYCIPI
jgi:hypothetical protein